MKINIQGALEDTFALQSRYLMNPLEFGLIPTEMGPSWKMGFSSSISCNILVFLGFIDSWLPSALFGDYYTYLGWMFKSIDIDDAFSTGTGLKRAGIARSVRCPWTLGSSAKTRNKKD